jgi:tetratricopeptide (TPR) repeat protein
MEISLDVRGQMAEYFYEKWLKQGGIENIDDAVEHAEEYIGMLPEGHPDRTIMESRLVTCLTEQYLAKDGDEAEGILRRAIVLAKKLYDSNLKTKTILSKRATNYALLLGHRNNSSQREPDDLNKSIELAEEAVAASLQANAIIHQEQGTIVKGSGDWIHIINTLCWRLEERFLVMGSLADLDRAIGIWETLIKAVAQEDSQGARPTWLSNLSGGLLRRYEQNEKGDPKDLRRSIDLSREALRSIGRGDPKRVEVVCMHAHALAQRGVEFDDSKDMDKAIELLHGVYSYPPNSHRAIEVGFNLAMRLFQRSQMKSNSEERRDTLHKAAVLIAVATLKFTPKSHPFEPHLHNLIGLCYFYARVSNPAERDAAAQMTIEHLSTALNSPSYVPVYRRVQAGRLILRLCCERGEWKTAYETSVKAINLIPKITSRSIRNADKQRLLSLDDVVGFSADAAAAALNAGEDGYAALNLLDMGRGSLAASVAELRADLGKLHQKHKKLADRFVELRDQLQMSSRQQYQANLDFDALLNEIRKKSGFENFLGPLRQEDILEAARDGPVVVLSASEFRGVDAILIKSDSVQVLRFAEITINQLNVLSLRNPESLEVLEWLWDTIAKPIIDTLGFTQPPPVGNPFPRIWWVLTGILSRFPLHAAGHHLIPTSTNTVMDRVMSSYSSSIKTLLRIRDCSYRPAVLKESNALLIAMSNTPKRDSLRHVFAEIEEVKELLKSKSCSCIALSDQPQKESVLQHLEKCQIFHFAGHGNEDISDPSRSSLLLHDWQTDPMTVESMLDLNLSERNCFIAYLSACETGRVTKPKFCDESIHLVSAFQLAGFRHVIGTLWPVDDFVSVQMATETYRIIVSDEESMTDASVCRGLYTAAMRLRDESREKLVKQAAQREEKDRSSARKVDVADISEDESDEDDHVAIIEQLWIPFVHFGV